MLTCYLEENIMKKFVLFIVLLMTPAMVFAEELPVVCQEFPPFNYLDKDGSVTGSWTGAYEARTDRNRNYETLREYKEGFLTNDFKGNTAPLKIYKDDRGEDKSKLYFITRGEFLLREGRENRKIHGALYVTGWIDRNYTARGELFLLSSSGGVADIEIFDWGPADPNTVE